MDVKIEGGLARVTYKKGARTYNKVVTLPAFVSALMQEQGIRTPLLPFGTRAYTRNDNKHTVLLEFQPAPRQIIYVNNDGKQIFKGPVPMPWGVFKLVFKENTDKTMSLSESYVYALKRPILSLNDQLFYYPVPNIFPECNICWGTTFSHEHSKIENIAEAGKIVDLFFSSQFNNHLSPRFNLYTRYEDLLRSLQDKKVFQYEVLVPVRSMNISSLM